MQMDFDVGSETPCSHCGSSGAAWWEVEGIETWSCGRCVARSMGAKSRGAIKTPRKVSQQNLSNFLRGDWSMDQLGAALKQLGRGGE